MVGEQQPAPRVIDDRYEVEALIGRGGSASVYRAWDRDLQRRVAVKVLPVEVGDSAVARRRSEAHLLASMNHPGLVTLYDATTDEDATCLVMELLEGGTLRDRIAAGPVQPATVSNIGAHLASALVHIHGRGVVHRDVKPANILLTAAGPGDQPAVTAKLSDFGIAKLLETGPSSTTGIMGTARYLSPEQAGGLPAGPASDVYSLGLTLLEALTGVPAFPGDAAEAFAARLVRDPVVPGSLGSGWRSLLTAMLARDPSGRPSAAAVEARLRDDDVTRPLHQDGLDFTVTMPLPSAVSESAAATSVLPVVGAERRRRPRVAIIGLAGLAGAVLLGAGLLVPAVLQGGGPAAPPAASSPAASARGSAEPKTAASAAPSSTARPVAVQQPAVERTSAAPSASAPAASVPAARSSTSGSSGPAAGSGSASKSKGAAKSGSGKGKSEQAKAKAKGKGKPDRG